MHLHYDNTLRGALQRATDTLGTDETTSLVLGYADGHAGVIHGFNADNIRFVTHLLSDTDVTSAMFYFTTAEPQLRVWSDILPTLEVPGRLDTRHRYAFQPAQLLQLMTHATTTHPSAGFSLANALSEDDALRAAFTVPGVLATTAMLSHLTDQDVWVVPEDDVPYAHHTNGTLNAPLHDLVTTSTGDRVLLSGIRCESGVVHVLEGVIETQYVHTISRTDAPF